MMIRALKMTVRAIAGAVLVLVVLLAVVFTAFGPQGAWTLAWLAAMLVTVTGAVWGLVALQPQWEPPCPCDCRCSCPVPCQRDDGTPGWCGPCRVNIHQEA